MQRMKKRWYRSICENDKEEFIDVARELQKQVIEKMNCKAISFYAWVYDCHVLPHCVVYNRAELIGTFHRIMTVEGGITASSDIMKKRAAALAKTLCFSDCLEQLEKIKCKESGCSGLNENPLDTLFTVNTRYTVDFDVLVSCLRILSVNGYHVNNIGSGGKTFFHDIITNYFTIQNINAMIEIGADINQIDEKGDTPLMYLLKKANEHFNKNSVVWATWSNPSQMIYRHEIVSAVKLCIYGNPLLELNSSIMEEAFAFDKTLFEAFGASDERFWREFLTPVLHNGGFGTSSDMDNIKRTFSFDEEFVKLVEDHLFKTPRKLKDIARIVLRRTHPGYKVKQLVDKISIGNTLAEYILMKDLKDSIVEDKEGLKVVSGEV